MIKEIRFLILVGYVMCAPAAWGYPREAWRFTDWRDPQTVLGALHQATPLDLTGGIERLIGGRVIGPVRTAYGIEAAMQGPLGSEGRGRIEVYSDGAGGSVLVHKVELRGPQGYLPCADRVAGFIHDLAVTPGRVRDILKKYCSR